MTCDRCGCTDTMSCLMSDDYGCTWAAPNLCSRCYDSIDALMDHLEPYVRLIGWTLAATAAVWFGGHLLA